ncbi:LPD7 domain-containing protein [Phenylobacterium sp. VNQ135]|uniref:LPD7 domain-containing protein n=1 Tax=Phenylobacterium sp. VNQ135 TaxID=3400922 RepID=UPI003C03D25C
MPDDPENTITAEGGAPSRAPGDVPEALRRRYFLDERGGPGLGFYADARIATPAFRDQGARLIATRPDPNAIRDMIAIAQHRGWAVVVLRGDADFRREAWLAAMAMGIEARGYRPTDRDHQELERRQAATPRRERAAHGPQRGIEPEAQSARAARANMRIVESVVRSRVAAGPAQDRILAAARERLASWLERSGHVRAVPIPASAERDGYRSRERHRDR